MNKAIGTIIIMIFIAGAGIALLQSIVVKPSEVGTATTTTASPVVVSTSTPPTPSPTETGPDVTPTKPPTSTVGKCYVGGCSSQICSGEEGRVSTCEYREAYACYQTAKCERQTTGQCGWTETSTLKTCLQSAQ